MKTGLKKSQKITNIHFTEAGSMIEVCTCNTDLKKRLSAFAAKYPEECRLTDVEDNGCLTFEIRKGRLSLRLTAPYSEARRKAASDLAKQHTENLRRGAHGKEDHV